MQAIRVDPGSPIGPARQIVEAVLDRIAVGELEPGDRLSSVRELAMEAMVNPNTVGKAYRDLGFLGVVVSRSGSGVFVSDEAPEIARQARRRTTLDEFRRAAAQALRAGHDEDRLLRVIEQLARTTDEAVTRGERR